MPFVVSIAHGPGRIAFSRDATGELVVLPLHPGMELDVREHAFLLALAPHRLLLRAHQGPAQHPLRRPGHVHGPLRDRPTQPGLLLLHGYGNVFERLLRPGESILVEPGAFLYKDASVHDERREPEADLRASSAARA